MSHAKQASKRKYRSKAVPVLGAAGLLSLASGAVAQAAGPAANLPTRIIQPSHELTLSEEEVFDVSLATFYVFDRETTPGFQLVRGGGGCGHGGGGCGCGHGGCHAMGGCGGFHACGGCGCSFRGCRGCRGCGCGCGGIWWGGGGCCLSWGACQFC